MRLERLLMVTALAAAAGAASGQMALLPRFGGSGRTAGEFATARPGRPAGEDSARASELLARLPMVFEAYSDTEDPKLRYRVRGPGYSLFAAPGGVNLSLRGGAQSVRMSFVTPAGKSEPAGEGGLASKSHYFLGSSPQAWRRNVANYSRVRYRDVWPGIDVVFYGNQRRLEYDVVVAPGRDPNAVRFRFDGAARLRVAGNGELVLSTPAGEMRQRRPVVYQDVDGVRKAIEGRYVLKGRKEVGFDVSRYDTAKPLVIDPILEYSVYLGGTGQDVPYAIALDKDGNAYIAGSTSSTDLYNRPALSSVQSWHGGGSDAFVVKLDPSGRIVYTAYIGGRGDDVAWAIAVDASGSAHVGGSTWSEDFPVLGAWQRNLKGDRDGFYVKLNPAGDQIAAASYYGGDGNDDIYGIALDANSGVYFTGYTEGGLPLIRSALQGFYAGGPGDCFAAKLNERGTDFAYGTYLGGVGTDGCNAIAVDSQGNAYVTGGTKSMYFGGQLPFNGYQNGLARPRDGDPNRVEDAFVIKLSPTGNGLLFGTYLGGDDLDEGYRIVVGPNDTVYVAGLTLSSNFPATAEAYKKTAGSPPEARMFDGFLTRLDNQGKLVYSTYLGGDGHDAILGLALDSAGNAFVTGFTNSRNFPILGGAFQAVYGGGVTDAFVSKLSVDGTKLLESSFVGGSMEDAGLDLARDPSGRLYLAGGTASNDFPISSHASRPYLGGFDAFVTKLADGLCDLTLTSPTTDLPSAGGSGTLTVAPLAAGCSWNLTSTAPDWLSVSPERGVGPLAVKFNAKENAGQAVRSGAVLSAGKQFSVRQAGKQSCQLVVYPNNVAMPSSSTGRTIFIASPSGAGCKWSASSQADWLVVAAGATGAGGGTLRIVADENRGAAARTGKISIGGTTVTVAQSAGGCDDLTLSSRGGAISKAGGLGSVRVIPAAGGKCSWTAASKSSWINVVQGANGLGEQTVRFSVAPNTGAVRTGSIQIGNTTYNVTQTNRFDSSRVGDPGAPASATGNSAKPGAARQATTGRRDGITDANRCGKLSAVPAGSDSVKFPAEGGTREFIITGFKTDGQCASTDVQPTTTSVARVKVTSPLTLSGSSGKLQYRVEPNQLAQSASATLVVLVGDSRLDLSISQAGASACQFNATPNVVQQPAGEVAGSIQVSAEGAACTWTAQSTDDWIQITNPTGSESGVIEYKLKTNTSASRRNGAIRVNDDSARVDVEQAGAIVATCTFSFDPNSIDIPAAGGEKSVNVGVTGAGCTWSATKDQDWLSFAGNFAGSGSATLRVRAAVNDTASQRVAIVGVDRQVLVVRQAEGTFGGEDRCTYTLSSSSAELPAPAGTGSFDVQTGAACPWNVSKDADWITLDGAASRTGPGKVEFSFQANSGASSRTGKITAGGVAFTVTQAGTIIDGCAYTLSSNSADFPAASGPGSFDVQTGASCQWNVSKDADWITLGGAASRTGPGKVEFSLQANSGASSRTGKITAAGVAFTVTQAGTDVIKGTLRADPNPILKCGGNGRTKLIWTSNATGTLEIRVNAPDGPMVGDGPAASGTVETNDWVNDGMKFYLVTPQGRALADVTVSVKCVPDEQRGDPPPSGDLTEGNLSAWKVEFTRDGQPSDGAAAEDRVSFVSGQNALILVTDTATRASLTYSAPAGRSWDFGPVRQITFWTAILAEAPGVKPGMPELVLISANGRLTLTPQATVSFGTSSSWWLKFEVPLEGGSGWNAAASGTFRRTNVTAFQWNLETVNPGFGVLLDGVTFTQ